MDKNVPKLLGLVLAGGKSTRMGVNKGALIYHGIPQQEYLYHLLDEVCEQVFVSLREDQKEKLPESIPTILDLNKFKGPYNGLLSAHEKYPNVAWLVLACDLPLMDTIALKELVDQRDSTKNATAFALKNNPLPEPLCAIWEPKALAASRSYLQDGIGTCPRKFLINHDTKLVHPKNENVLLNANSMEDYQIALEQLNS